MQLGTSGGGVSGDQGGSLCFVSNQYTFCAVRLLREAAAGHSYHGDTFPSAK